MKPSRERFFFLESCGRTATNWIAEAINRHPDVFTTHGIDVTPVTVDRTLTPDFKRPPDTALRSEADLHLDDYFDILEGQREESVIGSIHGYNAAVPYLNPGTYRRHYRIATVTRHPVIRTVSMQNQILKSFNNAESARDRIIARNRSFVETNLPASPEYLELLRTAKFDIDSPHDMAFILSILAIRNRDSVNFCSGMPIYLMERLTNEIDNFCHIFHFITEKRVFLSESFLDAVLKQPKRFASATERAGFIQYKGWTEWQRRLFILAMEHENLGGAYDALGYDMSYVC
ncbi:hypothetical protein HL658_33665 [Azospirillum sp. RWY-5-1]|uniref:hypothetical protein n=1 Tax=Azospirillum oleiclasticum TaxID=2735135 RepID=UPI0015D4AEF9|nr:hypothetical protein [Azospirillum oleiclasticum]NYZ17517.1 hypothetical protein [Azospirillum oleiclasticum]